MKNNGLPLSELKRNLFFSKQVTQDSIVSLTENIIEINQEDDYLEKIYSNYNIVYKREPIKIYIDSYGGNVYQCFGLLGVMKKSKTPIHTILTGAAMSCGFMILISGHQRFSYEYGTAMYHTVSNWMVGKIQELEEDLVETRRLQKIIEDITIQRTNITREMIKETKLKKQDKFFSATQCLKYKIIDKII